MSDPDDDDLLTPQPRTGIVGALLRYRQVLLIAAVVWIGLVIGGGLFLSQIDARYGLHVFGTGQWVAGERVVIRAALRDLQFNRYHPMGPLTVTLTDAAGEEAPVQRLTSNVGPFVQGMLVAPGRPGSWEVRIDTVGPDNPVTARFSVEVKSDPPAFDWPKAGKPKIPMRPDRGPVKLDIAALDHVLPGGLPGDLVVRASDAEGRAVSTTVRLETTEGRSAKPLPTEVITDVNGLATIDVLPMHPVFTFELSTEPEAAPPPPPDPEGDEPDGAEPAPPAAKPTAPHPPTDSWAIRQVRHTSTQFALELPRTVVRPGEALAGRLRSLHGKGQVFVDLWHGLRWLHTSGDQLRPQITPVQLIVPTPPTDPALIWVQAYRDAYLPGKAKAGRYLVVTQKGREAALRWLTTTLEKQGYAPTRMRALARGAHADDRLFRDLLGRLPRPEGEPPLLADSGITARQTVGELKGVWQSRLVLAMVASGAILFLVLGGLIWANERDVKRRWALAGGDVDGDSGTRRRLLLDAGYVFLVLALFLIGMIQLMLSIKW